MVQPGLTGWLAGFAGDAHRAARGLRDHVEGERFLVWAALAEALDLAIDDAGVDLFQHVIAKAEALDRAGGEVLGEHVGLFDQLFDQLDALLGLEVDRRRLLVGVEDLEIEGVVRLPAGRRDAPAGIARFRVLDLDDLGAKPGQGLSAGGTRLELGQIDDLDTRQTLQRRKISAHRFPLPWSRDSTIAWPDDTLDCRATETADSRENRGVAIPKRRQRSKDVVAASQVGR